LTYSYKIGFQCVSMKNKESIMQLSKVSFVLYLLLINLLGVMIKKIMLVLISCVFYLCTIGQTNDSVKAEKMLIGKWKSDEDSVFNLQVFKDHIIHFNKGEDDSDYFNYQITSIPCDTTIVQRSKTGLYLNEVGKDGLTTCSYVEALTEDSLELNYNWGARLLHFKRRK
jgi:hypothetical protein